MLSLLFLLAIVINVSAIKYFRKYSDSEEKKAFYSGILGLVLFPISIIGGVLSATNIQGIHGDLNGFTIILFLCFIATCYSGYSVGKLLISRKIQAKKREDNFPTK